MHFLPPWGAGPEGEGRQEEVSWSSPSCMELGAKEEGDKGNHPFTKGLLPLRSGHPASWLPKRKPQDVIGRCGGPATLGSSFQPDKPTQSGRLLTYEIMGHGNKALAPSLGTQCLVSLDTFPLMPWSHEQVFVLPKHPVCFLFCLFCLHASPFRVSCIPSRADYSCLEFQ